MENVILNLVQTFGIHRFKTLLLNKKFHLALWKPTAKHYAKNDGFIEEFLSCGIYVVTDEAKILSYRNRQGWKTNQLREIIPQNKGGYLFIDFRNKKLAVHRIVYRAKVGPLEASLHINHKDGNPSNNLPENLELVSPSENLRHSYNKLGRKPVVSNVKLTRSQVLRMRMLHSNGWSYRQLVKEFNTAKSNVASIVKFKSWKEVVEPE